MRDKRDILKTEKPFSYKKLKGDKAMVYWYGKQIMVISGKKYEKLLKVESKGDDFETQLVLASITGHFKHGNERKS